MSYQNDLPKVFPYFIEIPAEDVSKCIQELMTTETQGMVERFVNGSSFAVTSDAFRIGYRCLWLSEWSYKRLETIGIRFD